VIMLLTPSTETSMCPPRIMANDSALSKVEAPEINSTVALPALIMSLYVSISEMTAGLD